MGFSRSLVELLAEVRLNNSVNRITPPRPIRQEAAEVRLNNSVNRIISDVYTVNAR